MFKRNLEVKLVKPSKKTAQTEAPQPESKIEYAAIAVTSIREAVRGAAILTATYVTADTLRKVTVHVIATKFN